MAAALIEMEDPRALAANRVLADHWCMAANQALPVGPFRGLRRLLARAPKPHLPTMPCARRSNASATWTTPTPACATGWKRWTPRHAAGMVARQRPGPCWGRNTKPGSPALTGNGAATTPPNGSCTTPGCSACVPVPRPWVHRLASQASAADLGGAGPPAQTPGPACRCPPLYELALERSSRYPAALRGLVPCPEDRKPGWPACPFVGRGQQRPLVGCRTALAELETPAWAGPRRGRLQAMAQAAGARARIGRARLGRGLGHLRSSARSHGTISARSSWPSFSPSWPAAPRWRAAGWCARTCANTLSAVPFYLLFVELPGMDDEDRYELCRSLERTLGLPGPVLALWAGESPTCRRFGARRSSRCFRAEGPLLGQRPGTSGGGLGPERVGLVAKWDNRGMHPKVLLDACAELVQADPHV